MAVTASSRGEQTVSVYKDIRLLAPKAVDMMDALIKGQEISGVQPFSLKVPAPVKTWMATCSACSSP